MKKEEYDEFESWEGDYWLLENKQYGDLIKLRKQRAEKYIDEFAFIMQLQTRLKRKSLLAKNAY